MDFEALYAEQFARVYRFLLGLCRNSDLAEELAQETFTRALRRSGQFSGQCDIATWLCSIARNCYIDHCRLRQRETPMNTLPEGEAADFTDALMDREQALRVHRALHSLPEPYKEVFSLRVFGELEHAQICGLFGKSESWSRVTYYRAKAMIQQKLEEEEK